MEEINILTILEEINSITYLETDEFINLFWKSRFPLQKGGPVLVTCLRECCFGVQSSEHNITKQLNQKQISVLHLIFHRLCAAL